MSAKETFFIKLLKVDRPGTPYLIPGRRTEIKTITDTKFEKEGAVVHITKLYDGNVASESISLYPWQDSNLPTLQRLQEGIQETLEIRQDHQEISTIGGQTVYDQDTEIECHYCHHKFALKDIKTVFGDGDYDEDGNWIEIEADRKNICPNCNLDECCVLEYESISQYQNRKSNVK